MSIKAEKWSNGLKTNTKMKIGRHSSMLDLKHKCRIRLISEINPGSGIFIATDLAGTDVIHLLPCQCM